jgi:hypothetical protein
MAIDAAGKALLATVDSHVARAVKRLQSLIPPVQTRLQQCLRVLAVTDHRGRPAAAGSGVLLWHRGARYLVTAAHVLDPYAQQPLFVDTKSGWRNLVGTAILLAPPEKGRGSDDLDFAFFPIDAGFAEQLDGCDFLTASEVASPRPLSYGGANPSLFLVAGYPLNKMVVKKTGTSTPGSMFVAPLAPQDLYRRAKLDPRKHIAVMASGKVAGLGGAQTAPSMKGMSGGGIFRVAGVGAGDFTAPQLAAILIERRAPHQVAVGVDIGLVLTGIDQFVAGTDGFWVDLRAR